MHPANALSMVRMVLDVMAQWMTEIKIQIEIASKDDAIRILEIQKAAFQGQAEIYNNYELPPLIQSLGSIENEFHDKTFLKALLTGQIIGAVRFKVCEGLVTIERMVVKPEHQNKGVGSALLKKIESLVPNATAFQLFTGNKSARNIHLYQKIGYQEISRETTEQGIELLHMEKRP